MFSRITYSEFQLLFPVIGFFIFATVFAVALIRVSLMKKKNVNHLSSLPLEEEHFQSTKPKRHES